MAACSHGMQKRIGLGLATIHEPKVLILDEPFSGLDLFHIKALNDTIASRAAAGLITILSTHIAPYTAALCQEVYVVDRGTVAPLIPWSDAAPPARVEIIERSFFGSESAT